MAGSWHVVDTHATADGTLQLLQKDERLFFITIDGRVLMSSGANASEVVLAELACAPLKEKKAPRVLIGGLGMGFTLKAAIDQLPADAKVVVAELNPIVVQWCRGPIAHLTDDAVNDPRVTVVIDDVAAVIRDAAAKGKTARYDAIVLDLYEGPYEGDHGAGEHLYGAGALQRSRAALKGDGIFAVWSEDPDKAFEKRLAAAGFAFERRRPSWGGRKHVVYLATIPANPRAGNPGSPTKRKAPAPRALRKKTSR